MFMYLCITTPKLRTLEPESSNNLLQPTHVGSWDRRYLA